MLRGGTCAMNSKRRNVSVAVGVTKVTKTNIDIQLATTVRACKRQSNATFPACGRSSWGSDVVGVGDDPATMEDEDEATRR